VTQTITEEDIMRNPAASENKTCLSRRRTAMTPEQVRELERRTYWQSTIFELECTSASLIDGLIVPIIGDRLQLTLDFAIRATAEMTQHPDATQRWTHDTVLFYRSRLVAVVRATLDGIAITTFEANALPVTGHPGSLQSSIVLVDGSLDSVAYGVGIPLAGRALGDVLEESIKLISESIQNHDPDYRQDDDVALAFRGQILSVVRVSPEGPIVHRFGPLAD
jgi:hypothetical protein